MAPDHIEETIRSIRRLHIEHYGKSSLMERSVGRLTTFIGRPAFLTFLTCLVVAWVGLNGMAGGLGYPVIDAPPFPWLQGAMTLMSLFMVAIVLGTQKLEDELSEQREMITLELALLSEQKIAKMIALMEELRRDSPEVRDRIDEEAGIMAQPADPQAVFAAIKETHKETRSSAPSKPTDG